jgi:hypothetical protein
VTAGSRVPAAGVAAATGFPKAGCKGAVVAAAAAPAAGGIAAVGLAVLGPSTAAAMAAACAAASAAEVVAASMTAVVPRTVAAAAAVAAGLQAPALPCNRLPPCYTSLSPDPAQWTGCPLCQNLACALAPRQRAAGQQDTKRPVTASILSQQQYCRCC